MFVSPDIKRVPAMVTEPVSKVSRTRFGDISRTNRTASLMRVFTQMLGSVHVGLSHLEEGKYRQFVELDLSWLAFALLDFVAEQSEWKTGIERDRIINGVLPQACEQANVLGCFDVLGDDGIRVGLEVLFDALCNRSGRYKAFNIMLWDAESQLLTKRQFWFLKTKAVDGDRTALGNGLFELTDEAYLLLFGMMEQDALDLARINLLRMEMLLSRGAFGEAVSLADNNIRQAQRLTLEIRTLNRQILRSIASVDIERVEYLSGQGIEQLNKLQEDLDELGHVIRNHLDTITDTKQLKLLSMLKEKLDGQRKAMLILHNQIMALPDTYRQQQHKLFRRRSHMEGRRLPPLENFLVSLALLPIDETNRVADDFLAQLSSPISVDLFDPGSLLQQLASVLERQHTNMSDVTVKDEDIEFPEEFASPLTPHKVVSVYQWMREVIPLEGELLSRLLERARDEKGDDTAVAVQGIAIVSLDPQDDIKDSSSFRFHASPMAKRYSVMLGDGRHAHGHDLHLSIAPNIKDENNEYSA